MARRDAGSSRLLFGTSGVRGIVGQGLTLELCHDVARAVGARLPEKARVCIATDTRTSRESVRGAVIAGLRSSGIDVTSLGILPTPALAYLTRDMGFDTGIMITASHNPPEYNGVKLFNGNSIGYSRAQEAMVEDFYWRKDFRNGCREGSVTERQDGKQRYFQFLRGYFTGKKFNHRLPVVVDPGNGAAARFASELFSRVGLDVIPVNDEPDGRFPGRNPEPRADTLEATIGFLRRQDADLAICFDGDADRVVFCDRDGFLGFDGVIAFVSHRAVSGSGKKKVVTTVETGRLLDLALAEVGAEVIRGRVGDASVSYLTRDVDAAIGVEPVGVYIMPEAGYYPDSMFAALTLLQSIERAADIREFLQKLPRLFSQQEKIPCPEELKPAVMERLQGIDPCGAGQVNTLDGLRFEFDDSWLLIRASGTEPAIRLLAESGSEAQAKYRLGAGVCAARGALGEVMA